MVYKYYHPDGSGNTSNYTDHERQLEKIECQNYCELKKSLASVKIAKQMSDTQQKGLIWYFVILLFVLFTLYVFHQANSTSEFVRLHKSLSELKRDYVIKEMKAELSK